MPEIAFVFTADLAGGLVADCLHGANRLASNSLLECVVTTRLAAQTIADGQAFQAVPPKGRLNAPPPKQASFQPPSKTHSAAPPCKRSTNTI